MYCLHWHVTFLAFLSVIEFLLFDIIKMKMASYLIRLGSKGLGKDVTMPLVKAEKVSNVTKQFSNSLGQASDAREKKNLYTTLTTPAYDTTTVKSRL